MALCSKEVSGKVDIENTAAGENIKQLDEIPLKVQNSLQVLLQGQCPKERKSLSTCWKSSDLLVTWHFCDDLIMSSLMNLGIRKLMALIRNLITMITKDFLRQLLTLEHWQARPDPSWSISLTDRVQGLNDKRGGVKLVPYNHLVSECLTENILTWELMSWSDEDWTKMQNMYPNLKTKPIYCLIINKMCQQSM